MSARLGAVRGLTVAALLGVLSSGPLVAQSQSAPTAPGTDTPGAAQLFSFRIGLPDSLPCPDCHPKKHTGAAVGELLIVQAIPATVNNLRGAVWAKISPRTWSDNLRYPWQWDDNAFLNNQFSHPYHGSLYFNAARTNGYNFWGSAPWAFGGSLMWELFMEGWAPAPNDWYNTSLGGITLGEMLYRLSSLTTDNTATGAGRVWREIGATLLNPVRGFNRLVRGEAGRVSANPPDWRPSFIQGAIDVGGRRIGTENSLSGPSTVDQVFAQLRLNYGNLMEDVTKAPFSHFVVIAELTDKESQGQRGRLSRLQATGTLAGKELSRSDKAHHLLGLFMRYEYYNNPAFELGGQSFAGGWLARFGEGNSFVQTSLLGTFYPIAATRSDVYITEEGRNYDYGLGGGGSARARFVWWPRVLFTMGYDLISIHTLDGAKSNHLQGGGSADLRVQLTNRLGVGATYFNYYRHSTYAGSPTVKQTSPSLSFFLGYAIPGVER